MQVQTVPFWKTLREATAESPKVRALFAPVTRPMISRAWGAYRKANSDETIDDLLRSEVALLAFSHSLLSQGLVDFEGVLDLSEPPEPLANTEEARAALVLDPDFADLASVAYVAPIMKRELEKNGLALSPDGTFLEMTAPEKVVGAHPSAASGTAPRAPKKPRAKTTAAKSAPTPRSSLSPKKAAKSGR